MEKKKTIEAIREEEWKVRYTAQAGLELFNLQMDPGELYNRSEEFPELTQRLLHKMQQFALQTKADIHQE